MNGDKCYPREHNEIIVCCEKSDFIKSDVFTIKIDGEDVDAEFHAKCEHCERIVATFLYGAWEV